MATLVKTRTRVVNGNEDEGSREDIGDGIPEPFPLAVVKLQGPSGAEKIEDGIAGGDVQSNGVGVSETTEVSITFVG